MKYLHFLERKIAHRQLFLTVTNVIYVFPAGSTDEAFKRSCSPKNSPWQSVIAEGLAEANSVFIVITSAKILPKWLLPSKIYIHFTIFNTYFLTKLSFTNKRHHLHVLKKCMYGSVICFWQFIYLPSLVLLNSFFHLIFSRSKTRCYRVSNSCWNVLISMILFEKKRKCQNFDVRSRQHSHNFCYIMIVLMRGVLTAKLVLRYKHKFKAIQ